MRAGQLPKARLSESPIMNLRLVTSGRFCLCAVQWILLIIVPSAPAQTACVLTGRVSDKLGAPIRDATVTISQLDTGFASEIKSTEAGDYRLVPLSPGNYRIEVHKEGFRRVTQDGIRLEVDQVARINFVLEVGDRADSISVVGTAPLLEADTSSMGQVVEGRLTGDLPLNGRNFVQLATLGPGVVGVGYGASGTVMSGNRPTDPRPGSEIFSNGNREQSNSYLLDGVDNGFRRNGLIALRPSVEAVREFKVQTNLFAAEQGRKPGATINVITKSGSNGFHGSAYDFLRNSAIDARNYFADPVQAKPALRQNQFGASLGGPAVRNRLFFFTNYEGYRRRLETVSVNTVPTEAVRRGDFSLVRDIFDPFTVRQAHGTVGQFVRDPFPGRQIPRGRFDSVTPQLADAYPLPQGDSVTNNHRSNPNQKQDWNQVDVRLDGQVSESDAVFGRFSRQDTNAFLPSTFAPVLIASLGAPVNLGEDGPSGDSTLTAHNAVLSWTRTFDPSLVMEAKMGYTRFDSRMRQTGVDEGDRLGERLGVRNANQGPLSDGLPVFALSGFTGIGQSRAVPTIRIENSFNPRLDLTKVAGRHTLKTGLNIIRRQLTDYQLSEGNGRYEFNRDFTSDPNNPGATGDSMASFLLGTGSAIRQDFLLAWVGIRVTEFGLYLQDDWRVTDRLTFNLGIRYEYDTPPSEVADRWLNFDVETGHMRIAGINANRNVGVKPDRNNVAPRFGFALRLGPTTVLRGGYGIFYNTQGNGRVSFRLHRQVPLGLTTAVDVDQFSPEPKRVEDGFEPIPDLDPSAVAENPAGNLLSLVDDFKSGYAQQFNLQVQHQLPGWDTVFKFGYVANLSRQLQTFYDYNQPVPGPGEPGSRRPLRHIAPDVRQVRYGVSDGIGNYHSLQASAEKRFSGGLSFLTAYTWAHSIDNVPNEQGGGANGPVPQDIRNRAAERATSGFDVQHRFVQSAIYELPVGNGKRWSFASSWANQVFGDWQASAILTAQTGLPFTPVLQTSVSNAGDSRPNRLRKGTLPDPDPARWFDTSFGTPGAAWVTPETYTFGNSGRNVLRGPGRVNLDISLVKEIPLTERIRLQFRAELFNAFNTPQFGLPSALIGALGAGSITETSGNSRQAQLALRLSF
jgi:carboxypeptidase family protein/TonB-dependent receptor-like protein